MKKINAEVVKNTISTIIAFGTLIILTFVIVSGILKRNNEVSELEGGNIQKAIETGQY